MKHDFNGNAVKNGERMNEIFMELKKTGRMDVRRRNKLWEELYALLSSQVKAVVSVLKGGEMNLYELIEAAAQETAIRVNEHIDSYDEEKGAANTWTNAVIRNALRKVSIELNGDEKGEGKVFPLFETNDDGEEFCVADAYRTAESPYEHMEHNENCRDIMKAVDSLSEPRRSILLHSIDGKSVAEIRFMLGFKDNNTVYRYLNRARMDVDRILGLNYYKGNRNGERERNTERERFGEREGNTERERFGERERDDERERFREYERDTESDHFREYDSDKDDDKDQDR